MSDPFRDFDSACSCLDREAWDDAVRLFRRARNSFFIQGNLDSASVCDMNIGVALESLGDFTGALSALNDAADFFSRNNESEKLADCRVNRGVVLEALGRSGEALADYESAYSLYAELDIPQNAAVSKINSGIVMETLGDYRHAVVAFEVAKRLFDEIGDEEGSADASRALQRLDVYGT
ncbi:MULTISPECIES: tetratricopeptide repeat protein [unclassified Rhodococcus (in: high G+C Gram-positive bacteria)]|uniref:tetratricopeptide repeat protein n=1 Tax=unclassified Rhodococcus (in: high G+C Gram-positive bacteria) TaxID=192944 RepID=UPI0015C685DB|nr:MULTISPECIES: tetratricopeptide repeat protein [unclassified Rhodococcus (in: high G+C Gram-positive bacteria)]